MQQSVMIADANAAQYWRKHLTAAYKKACPHHPLLWINVPSDKNHPERYKNLSTVTQIYRVLWKYKCQRQTTLLMALGGGVLLDMVGFVAATYQRGLPLWMFPSTTMAAVDASIGGKNGINWRKRKNQIGTIRPPEHIFVVLDYLRTQTKRHKHAGLAEVVKIAALADAHFFRRMQTHTALILAEDPTVWKHIILKAAQLKYAFVEQDLLDRGARQALNWGHTLGHAFEILSEGKLYHGEAVSLGLLAEYAFACRQQQGSPVLYAQLEQLLGSLSLPTNWQSYIQHYNLSALCYALEGDKKRQGENVLLTTVAPLGVWSFYKASVKSLLEFLKEYTD
jgi:3-dehydroquinate synthase